MTLPLNARVDDRLTGYSMRIPSIPSPVFSRADKKLLWRMGLVVLAFAVIVARLATGHWWGIFLAVGYGVGWILMWIPGYAPDSSARLRELETELRAKEAEIEKLKSPR